MVVLADGTKQGLVAGLQAVKASMNLLGIENEDVIKSLEKMQNLMALTQALPSIDNGIKAFKRLGLALKSAVASANGLKAAFITTGIGESVQFAITKQFEDLSNPTTIINSWSKTVSIPFTEKNNILFGHIYNADRLIAEGGTSITGIYFNPYKKLDFRLQWGDSVLMVGYAKMNEVKQNNGKGTYEITLFGELGKVFQDLKKITFDTTTTEPDYLISGDTWVDEKINKDLVYNSWTSSGQTHEELYPKYFYPAGSTIPTAFH